MDIFKYLYKTLIHCCDDELANRRAVLMCQIITRNTEIQMSHTGSATSKHGHLGVPLKSEYSVYTDHNGTRILQKHQQH